MRLAVIAVALLLLPCARAHADTMLNMGLPDVSFPSLSSVSSSSDDVIESPGSVVLPEETGAMLSAQTGTGVTPEPSSVVLMGSGLLCFGGLIWRRRAVSRAAAESAS